MSQVVRFEPPAVQHLGCLLGVVPITQHHVVPADKNLAGGTRLGHLSGLVTDFDLDARNRDTARA